MEGHCDLYGSRYILYTLCKRPIISRLEKTVVSCWDDFKELIQKLKLPFTQLLVISNPYYFGAEKQLWHQSWNHIPITTVKNWFQFLCHDQLVSFYVLCFKSDNTGYLNIYWHTQRPCRPLYPPLLLTYCQLNQWFIPWPDYD